MTPGREVESGQRTARWACHANVKETGAQAAPGAVSAAGSSTSITPSLRHIKMDLKRHFAFSLLNTHIIATHRLLF